LKDQLLRFIDALRAAGIATSIAESLDATRAVATVGLDRTVFREALAATLVKDEAERPTFDAVFDRFFAAPRHDHPKRGRRQPTGTDGASGAGAARGPSERRARQQLAEPPAQSAHGLRETRERERSPIAGRRLASRRTLERLAFQELSSRDVEACDLLVAVLAQRLWGHVNRRQRAAHRGRVDIRRTLRRSAGTGGVPIDPAFRRRRPGRPDLVALCDHSYSVATASHFLIALLLPAAAFFRRVHLFAFVDRPVEVSVEHGRLVPHAALDLYARSDFGRVLVGFWEAHSNLITRNTTVLILGDARNNRRPPRADVLAKIHVAAGRVVWLNPEPGQRWNTADSVMEVYRRHCDAVVGAGSLRALEVALTRVFRTL
jgi:uncharacterized protein with von Willebrand factor type A (vWA) domain